MLLILANGWEGFRENTGRLEAFPTSVSLLSGPDTVEDFEPIRTWTQTVLPGGGVGWRGQDAAVTRWCLQIFSSRLSCSGANNLINTIRSETSFYLFNFPVDMRNALMIFISWYYRTVLLMVLKILAFSQIFYLGYNAIFITFLCAKQYKLF